MKVPTDPPASSPPPSQSGEPSSSRSKSFDKVLERKSGEQKGRNNGQEPASQALEDDGTQGAAMSSLLPMRDVGSSASAKVAATPAPQVLDGLVQEIAVVAGKDPR